MVTLKRPHYFLFALLGTFFNPLVIHWYGTSRTFIVIVPITLLVWFAVKWDEFVVIDAKSRLGEILLGGGVYAADFVWNGLSQSAIGLLDMFVLMVALIVAFFGLKSVRQHFLLPTAYLGVLVFSYPAENAIPEIQSVQNFLAQVLVGMLTLMGIKASIWASNSDIVTVWGRQGIPGANPFALWIEKSCTGVKGMLAYGSLAILMVLDLKATVGRKLLISLVGLVGTFGINILRLFVIFLSAYQWGVDAGLEVHAYLGYLLFIAWILVYWSIAFRYVSGPTMISQTTQAALTSNGPAVELLLLLSAYIRLGTPVNKSNLSYEEERRI